VDDIPFVGAPMLRRSLLWMAGVIAPPGYYPIDLWTRRAEVCEMVGCWDEAVPASTLRGCPAVYGLWRILFYRCIILVDRKNSFI